MKKLLICITLLAIGACTNTNDWNSRGPDTNGVSTHPNLILPPDFDLRAPVPNAATTPAQQIDDEAAIPTDVPSEASEEALPVVQTPEVNT